LRFFCGGADQSVSAANPKTPTAGGSTTQAMIDRNSMLRGRPPIYS
jgi:hypothetical protein